MKTINDFIKDFVEQLEHPELVNETTKFKELGSWDSLTSMAVQTMIEDNYGAIIDDIEINQAATIQDLFNLVNTK